MREMTQLALQFRSGYIINFMTHHRVNYYRELKRETNQGGIADIASPLPIVGLYLDLLAERRDIFSQDDFIEYCLEQLTYAPSPGNLRKITLWKVFWQRMGQPGVTRAYRARLGRNFYIPLTNQFHALVLLHELGWFDRTWMDAETDASAKHDLICVHGNKLPIAIDIRSNSEEAERAALYKHTYRPSSQEDACYFKVYQVPIDIYRPCKFGGMVFVCPKDFETIVREYLYDGSLWGYPTIPCYFKCHKG